MGMIEAVKICFSKYFVFSGRARRAEYWWFYLFTVIGGLATLFADTAVFGFDRALGDEGFTPINWVFSLLTIIPTISAGARRLHDTNRSGWMQLLPLVGALPFALLAVVDGGVASALALIGVLAMLALVILLIVWLASEGTSGPNKYGDDPFGNSLAETFD